MAIEPVLTAYKDLKVGDVFGLMSNIADERRWLVAHYDNRKVWVILNGSLSAHPFHDKDAKYYVYGNIHKELNEFSSMLK